MNQLSQVQNFQFLPDIAAALQSFGPAAEEDVAALLDERSIETRHQACLILKQIGTSSSLGALQKVIGDPNVQLNQAAAEAIRAIKQRQ
jgi:HEAT repeat protein